MGVNKSGVISSGYFDGKMTSSGYKKGKMRGMGALSSDVIPSRPHTAKISV